MKMIISYEDDNCHSIGGHLHEDDNCRSIKQRAYHYQFRGGNVQFCDDDGIDEDDDIYFAGNSKLDYQSLILGARKKSNS